MAQWIRLYTSSAGSMGSNLNAAHLGLKKLSSKFIWSTCLDENETTEDFPSSLVVKTSPSNVGGAGPIPVRELRSHMP